MAAHFSSLGPIFLIYNRASFNVIQNNKIILSTYLISSNILDVKDTEINVTQYAIY